MSAPAARLDYRFAQRFPSLSHGLVYATRKLQPGFHEVYLIKRPTYGLIYTYRLMHPSTHPDVQPLGGTKGQSQAQSTGFKP
eukprot:9015680-Pyramimonas_sp.AAC.1